MLGPDLLLTSDFYIEITFFFKFHSGFLLIFQNLEAN